MKRNFVRRLLIRYRLLGENQGFYSISPTQNLLATWRVGRSIPCPVVQGSYCSKSTPRNNLRFKSSHGIPAKKQDFTAKKVASLFLIIFQNSRDSKDLMQKSSISGRTNRGELANWRDGFGRLSF